MDSTNAPLTTADGSRTIYSPRYGQTFHSRRGALSEARHVFLEASGVGETLRRGFGSRVLEVGFGLGLNFLVSADLATHRRGSLEYLALERELPAPQVMAGLGYERHLEHPEVFAAYLAFRASLPAEPPAERYRAELNPWVTLELVLGEADGQVLASAWADAVYHDAFSPDANPELWSEAFLGRLHAALRAGGRLSSYCVKGAVRRRLQALGFQVEKRPGPPGGKREMLLAHK